MLFHVLGPLEAHAPDGGVCPLRPGKPTALLAALLLHRNTWVSVDRLIDAVWREQTLPASAAGNLKSYICGLRRTLGETRIESKSGAYRIRVAEDEIDVGHVMRLAARAEQAEPETAAGLLTEALALWRGRPFDGLEPDPASPELARLDQLRLDLREKLATTCHVLGRFTEAVTLLQALTSENPLHERSWTRLVRALCAAGRRTEALAAYREARTVLVSELGVEPSAELAEAHRVALLGQAAMPPMTLPRDTPSFVGRTPELDRLHTLRRSPGVPVAVVDGMAGVGKTALAVRFAHQAAEHFPDGQLFLDLHGRLSAAEALGSLLRITGATLPSTVDERAALWRSFLAHRRVLLVLDDATDLGQIRPLLPSSPGSMVVVTTRSRLLCSGPSGVTLDVLDDETATRLFLTEADDWRTDAEPGAVADLVRLCGGLPAALTAAAALLRRRPPWTVSRLAARLAIEHGHGIGDRLTDTFSALPGAERRLLQRLSRLPGDFDSTLAAVAGGMSLADVLHTLETLVDRHLLVPRAADRYGFHPVVRSAARVTTEFEAAASNRSA